MGLLPAVIWYVLCDISFGPPGIHSIRLRTQKDPSIKAAKEGAFKASAEWLMKYM